MRCDGPCLAAQSPLAREDPDDPLGLGDPAAWSGHVPLAESERQSDLQRACSALRAFRSLAGVTSE